MPAAAAGCGCPAAHRGYPHPTAAAPGLRHRHLHQLRVIRIGRGGEAHRDRRLVGIPQPVTEAKVSLMAAPCACSHASAVGRPPAACGCRAPPGCSWWFHPAIYPGRPKTSPAGRRLRSARHAQTTCRGYQALPGSPGSSAKPAPITPPGLPVALKRLSLAIAAVIDSLHEFPAASTDGAPLPAPIILASQAPPGNRRRHT